MKKIKSSIKKIIPIRYHPSIRMGIRYITSLLYLGNQFQCPICQSSFRRFKTYSKRPQAQCPRCGSFERQRLLHIYLQNETNFYSSNLSVLHFAPEQSLQRIWRSMPNLHYLSADISSSSADVKMDITNIPLKDNSFDFIVCFHVLEHIPDDRKAMKELFRILKPNGHAILNVPIDKNIAKTFEDPSIKNPQDRERIFGQDDHVRIYGLDYKDRLEESEFSVNVIPYTQKLELTIIKKYCIPESLEIWDCSKYHKKV